MVDSSLLGRANVSNTLSSGGAVGKLDLLNHHLYCLHRGWGSHQPEDVGVGSLSEAEASLHIMRVVDEQSY